ncbi:MAG: hypothetical protein SFX73_29360 [Kofleriaceae bacterium]|nr:hypothetical protein [Kofleriaceae bacterium]
MHAGLGLAVWLLLGCGGGPAASTTPTSETSGAPVNPSPEVEEAIGVMTTYQDRMCACTDKACVEKVAAEMGAWAEKQAKKYAGHEPVPSDEQKQRMTTVSEKLGSCMTQAASAPPPAE